MISSMKSKLASQSHISIIWAINMQKKQQLSDEDQTRVDEYLSKGFNKTEKKPYKPWTLLFILFIVVSAMGFVAIWLGKFMGVDQ